MRFRLASFHLAAAALLFAAACGDNTGGGGGRDLATGSDDRPAEVLPDLPMQMTDLGPQCSDEKQCAGPTPYCDKLKGKCVGCVTNDQCPDGQICRDGGCVAGCDSVKSCGDAGTCDKDAGLCRVCKADADCPDPAAPRCLVNSGRCVACLPEMDNCTAGTVCTLVNNDYQCAKGCKKDDECKAGDGGVAAGICCNNVCVDADTNAMNCGKCGGACAMGQSCCTGSCFDLQADVKSCGQCGNACKTANATPACNAGKCEIAKCNDGFDDCDKAPDDGCEADLNGDPANCTGCGKVCAVAHGKPGCSMGCKVASCDPGFDDCNKMFDDGCEADLNAAQDHCGGCGMGCGKIDNGSSVCDQGKCKISMCGQGFVDCDQGYMNGCEIDGQNDAKNCGACGKLCPQVPNGTIGCKMGVCGVGGCTMPFLDCNMDAMDGCEVDSSTEVKHCGGCGMLCAAVANGTPGCTAGKCVIASCGGGFRDCNMNVADGCEINLNTDVKNCSDCMKPCAAVANGAPTCNNGNCDIGMCNAPFKDCNNNYGDGCEIDTSTDVKNCGGCGMACPAVTNGVPGCVAGKCVIATCNAPFKDCDNNAANGCETNTAIDVINCGTCALKCPVPMNGSPSCLMGQCGIASCGDPFIDCNKSPNDGCEVNISNDVNNCGACSNKCAAVANGTPGCAAKTCGISSCNAPFKDCNGGAANGCETNSSNDVNNCGACGNKCAAIANGTPGCANSQCGIGACTQPFIDCKNGAADGCETNASNDVKNCGGCDKVCPLVANGTPGCAGGMCGIGACTAPFKDCNGGAANGCETNSGNDVNNCGACANKCAVANGVPNCANSACGIASCTAPFRDCNGGYANGCETNINTDLNNCGACNNKCAVANGTPNCGNGSCGIASCSGLFRDCNGGYANGCETNAGTDVNNCGACNNKCAVANGTPNCANGGCGIASCSGTFRDCNGGYGNGCETNVNTDPNNCGACGTRCASGVCTNGACLYAPSGVQVNVPVTTVTGGGWTQCYKDTYGISLPYSTIMTNNCTKARIMIACRVANSGTISTLAWAPKADVYFNVGNGNAAHNANNVGWYYSPNFSWGYAPQGGALARNQCDTNAGADRLCWHTINGVGGWRCGATTGLNANNGWDRLVYQAD